MTVHVQVAQPKSPEKHAIEAVFMYPAPGDDGLNFNILCTRCRRSFRRCGLTDDVPAHTIASFLMQEMAVARNESNNYPCDTPS